MSTGGEEERDRGPGGGGGAGESSTEGPMAPRSGEAPTVESVIGPAEADRRQERTFTPEERRRYGLE